MSRPYTVTKALAEVRAGHDECEIAAADSCGGHRLRTPAAECFLTSNHSLVQRRVDYLSPNWASFLYSVTRLTPSSVAARLRLFWLRSSASTSRRHSASLRARPVDCRRCLRQSPSQRLHRRHSLAPRPADRRDPTAATAHKATHAPSRSQLANVARPVVSDQCRPGCVGDVRPAAVADAEISKNLSAIRPISPAVRAAAATVRQSRSSDNTSRCESVRQPLRLPGVCSKRLPTGPAVSASSSNRPARNALLDRPQQFGLYRQRQAVDLVEQQCAVFGLGELAPMVAFGAGERPADMAEHLAFDQRRRQRPQLTTTKGLEWRGEML